jgi:hypothetical protein
MGTELRVLRSYLAPLCAVASLTLSACAGDGAEQSVPLPGGEPPGEPEVVVPSKVVEGPCASATAGGGFVNLALATADKVLVADLVATPAGDTVHGLSLGAADSDGDLAAAVRFANGTIEARDGNAYRADAAFAYTEGTSYDVRIIADLASGTYSVMTMQGGEEGIVLARNYRLSAPVEHLDMLATLGAATVCVESDAPDVIFQRFGAHSVVADAGLISDGVTTTRIGDRGETIARLPRGGELAVDASGNIYLARVEASTLTVESLTAGFGPRWTRTYAAPFGSQPKAVAVTTRGDIEVLLAGNNMFAMHSIASDGTPRWTRDVVATAVVPNRAGYALARTTESTVTVEQFDHDGNPAWSRTWPNTVDVQQIASSPTGQVIFAGGFTGTIDFGGLAIAAHPPGANGALNAYVVALSPTGEHVFSQRINERTVTAIASNGTQTIVAGHHVIGPLMTTRYTFDQTGEITDWREGLAGFGWFGKTYALALSTSGRVFWSYGPSWPDNFTEWPQLVAY